MCSLVCLISSARSTDKPRSVNQMGMHTFTRGTAFERRIIYLGESLPIRSSGLPGTQKKTSRFPLSEGSFHPCLTLLRLRVAWPLHYCRRRWSLTPPFHPDPNCNLPSPCSGVEGAVGRFVSVARSGRFFRRIPAPGVTRQPALWSADFPRGR